MSQPLEKQQLSQMVVGGWITQGIHVAAELGIADLLEAGPRAVAELAQETQTNAGALYRLLRALAGIWDFFRGSPGTIRIDTPCGLPQERTSGYQPIFCQDGRFGILPSMGTAAVLGKNR